MPFLLSSENVTQYLLQSNLCCKAELPAIQVEAGGHGKNFNLLISLPNNRKLLVKQERHWRNGKSAREFVREWQFHKLIRQFPEVSQLGLTVSELIHFDDDNSIIIYNYLLNYFDLDKFYRQERVFTEIIAAEIGKAIAILHRTTINRHECRNFITQSQAESPTQINNSALGLERVRPEIFGSVPTDCLKFFVLYQRYKSLGAAVSDLSASWYPCCIIHSDLKLNNILLHESWQQFQQGKQLSGNLIRLIDWERCTWGDPAFDLGALIASYLQIWLDSLVTDASIPIEESLRLAVTPLQIIRPSIVTLLKAYIETFPAIQKYYPDFLKRVIQFTGLGLIERISMIIEYQKHFGNKSICMLQVAKSLLCRPEQSIVNIFGTTESELAYYSSFVA